MSPSGGAALPVPGHLPSEADVTEWFGNVRRELDAGFLDAAQHRVLDTYYREAGLLSDFRRPFFLAHFCRPLSLALSHIFAGARQPRIIDLGCGTGTQAILFALLGGEVLGVDTASQSLEILATRKAYYERLSGRKLKIRCLQEDAFRVPYSDLGPFDGIWSLFAFNMMQPSRRLLDCILPAAAPGCRMAIMDGNRLHWGSKFRKRPFSPIPALAPPEFAEELSRRGFRVTAHRAGVGLPPVAWKLLPHRLLRSIEERYDGNWRFPVSHLILSTWPAGKG